MLKKRMCVLILMLLLVIVPRAQDNPAMPMLDMLALVPASTMAENGLLEVYFADIAASVATRPGTQPIENLAQWDVGDENTTAFINALPRTLPAFGQYSVIIIDDDGATTGFRFFDIERTLQFGQPPSQGIILEGDFDSQAIADAYTANNHEIAEQTDEALLLCSVDGCDAGLEMNLESRNQANPFGGNFGRVEPLLVSDTRIINSADFARVEQMRATQAGDNVSLADVPDVQSIVSAAYEQGILRQAMLLNAQPLDVAMILGERATAEQQARLREQLGFDNPDFGLPPYALFMIANTADLDTMTDNAHFLIAYNTEADAQEAAEKIATALDPETGTLSLATNSPIYESLANIGEVLAPQVVYIATTDQYVVVVTLSSELPQALTEKNDVVVMSGLGFNRFLDMALRRDLAWLTPRSAGN